MVARFHLWLRNILVVNNRWCQYSSFGYTVASTSVSLCKLGKYSLYSYIAYLMMMYSLAVVHGMLCIPSL